MEEDVTQLIDEAARNGAGNQRFLEPSATPAQLRSVPYAIAIPCPTRVMTRETGMAIAHMVKPMFGNSIPISPDSLEVGEARNQCVERAREAGAEWIFFVDYDVAPPANALVKLLSLKIPIAAGVYHLKQVPSYPLIYVKGWPGAFEDYEEGDLIKVDGIGMGCTLIKMSVFDEIEKKCGKPFFKTVSGCTTENPNVVIGSMTEDIYFCEKAKKAGFDIVVDTSIQAGHIDWKTGIMYHGIQDVTGKSRRITPAWTYRRNEQYLTETVADASHPARAWSRTEPPKRTSMRLDLGSGPVPMDGFIGVDLYAEGENVLRGDITDLGWFRKEHGLADEIRSSHSLEHLGHRDAPRILRDWVSTLKPGGRLTVIVPDLEFHCRKLVESIDKGEDRSPEADYWIATIYGWQINEGHIHLNGFTENRLRQLALSCGLEDVEIGREFNKGSASQEIAENAGLVLTGTRPKGKGKK